MNIQIRAVETNPTVTIAVRDEKGNLKDLVYMTELISDFPKLGVSFSLGTTTSITPEKNIPGYKAKSIKRTLYQPLLTYRFNERMQPSIEKHGLLDERVSPRGSTVCIYENGKLIEKEFINHLDVLNNYVLPNLVSILFDPKNVNAKFSSWVYVGLLLVNLVDNDIALEGEHSFKQSLQEITQEQVFLAVIEARNAIATAKAYVSPSHNAIAENLQAKQFKPAQ